MTVSFVGRRATLVTGMLLGLCVPGTTFAEAPKYDLGSIPAPVILLPKDAPTAMVMLLSDRAGWTADDGAEAKRLNAKGAIVVGVDTPKYLESLARQDGDCIYAISDVESLSQQIQRAIGNTAYFEPIVAGIGEGGALAQVMLAQTPNATIGETLAVDPTAGIPVEREFCTPAEKKRDGGTTVYGLTDGPLPDSFTVVFTPEATADAKAHAQAMLALHDDIDIRNVDTPAREALSATLDELMAGAGQEASPLGLPLTILETKPTHNTLAIVYSGDGGWRDIDQEVGDYLQKIGIPVVGVDSLHYFWSKRSPQQTAADLARIIGTYRKQWNVEHVLLIGYSFGADILPSTYNLLPQKQKERITQLSLLAMSREADFEISVAGWLGASGAGEGGNPVEALKDIDPKKVQCIYGTDDDESGCPDLKAGQQVLAIDGGHHFDEDYEGLAKRIVDPLFARVGG